MVPDSNTGDIMGELNKRRGRVLGMNPTANGDAEEVEADVPMSEMHDFSTVHALNAPRAGAASP